MFWALLVNKVWVTHEFPHSLRCCDDMTDSRGGPSCRMVTSLHMTSARLRAAEETRMLGPQACRVTGIVSCFSCELAVLLRAGLRVNCFKVAVLKLLWIKCYWMKNSAWMLHPYLCDSVSPLISSHHVTSFPLLISRCSCGVCIRATPPPQSVQTDATHRPL